MLQLFTKAPSRWADPIFDDGTIAAFRNERERWSVGVTATHGSYLVNLASSDRTVLRRSVRAFRNELERSECLGIDYLIAHPGHATDGWREAALERNAQVLSDVMSSSPGRMGVLLETTAGAGNALGATFEELAALIEALPSALRSCVGVCMDTCHVWAAGYDLRADYHGVFTRFDDVIGLDRLRFFHLNDSVASLGSRRDRHADIGRGKLGTLPFARLLDDPRFAHVPKVIETPKGSDAQRADRLNLRRLRRLRANSLTLR